MSRLLHAAAFSVLCLLSSPSWAATEIINLQHRLAADLLPALTPLLAANERLVDYGQQLIVHANADTLADIRALVQQLDTPAKRLLITVDTQGTATSRERGISAQGRIKGRAGEVVIGQPSGRNRVEIKHYGTQHQDGGSRSVQTLEGSTAFVQTGQQIPQRQWSYDQYGRPVQQIEQRDVMQGFYVTARVHNDRVTLELNSENSRLDRQQSQVINTQSTATRLSGRLNEWIYVSGHDATTQNNQSQLGTSSKRYSSDNNSLRVKVELLDE